MTRSGMLLLGLTAIVGGLAGLLTFAMAKFFDAARRLAKDARPGGGENALMTSAMQDALGQLRVQERAMAARAEASERLSGEIVASIKASKGMGIPGCIAWSLIGPDDHVIATSQTFTF